MNSTVRQILQTNLKRVEEQIQSACVRAARPRADVQLIAVTKSVSIATAALLPKLGQTHLAESRPQELWRKAEAIPLVQWHQIGYLQTNKIDKTLSIATIIHSLDRLRLLDALEKEANKQHRTVNILLEVNAAREAQKHGFAPEELESALAHVQDMQHVHLQGLMTMAAFEEDPENCRPTFALLHELRDKYRDQVRQPHALQHLSMGMSNDFTVAIEEGATMIRLGSILFEGIEETA